ncbi:hypothetical protein [Ectobacillus polymachus]|uniref:hypothetical protein n=1 Tax=Ectobacillus polymachus TaxID=1508806 RepID=UPI003A8B7D74
MNENLSFLNVVQQSQLKKNASLEQLLCLLKEDVEELADEVGYEAMIEREYDEELEELLGESLFLELQNRLLVAKDGREEFITFIDGLGFHLLDWAIVLETECGVHADFFTSEILKKIEKRFPRFPYVNQTTTIFDLTIKEVNELLIQTTGKGFTC